MTITTLDGLVSALGNNSSRLDRARVLPPALDAGDEYQRLARASLDDLEVALRHHSRCRLKAAPHIVFDDPLASLKLGAMYELTNWS